MYSKKDRWVWIGVNKTASSSMATTIKETDEEKSKEIVFDHRTLIKTKKKLNRSKINKYYKISMIRNPFDRVTSLYQYRVRKFSVKPHTITRPRSPSKEDGSIELFNEWVKRVYTVEGIENSKHLGQQIRWIVLDDKIGVNHLGYFDDIDDYWKKLCEVVKIPYQPLQWRNKSKKDSFKSYYDEETYDIIENVYKDDIKLIKRMGYKLW